MTVLSDYNAAVAAVESYGSSAASALSGDAGGTDGEGAAFAFKDQALGYAIRDSNAALEVLTEANVERIKSRLTTAGL